MSSEISAMKVDRVLRFRLCSADAESLADFYTAALGFREISVEHLAGAQAKAFSDGGADALRIALALGAQQIEIVEFPGHPGKAYPADTVSSDLVFQHFAIVVTDMDAAMRQLESGSGWSPITVDGPQHLPQSSGGVTAYKFRDPEAHPLELLAFPPDGVPPHWQHATGKGPFLGIDHSAISVSDTQRSVAFYEALGLTVSNRSVNDDPEQARLDHLQRPAVEVTAMTANHATPHVELLCYRHGAHPRALHIAANDVATTCIIFRVGDDAFDDEDIGAARRRSLRDPDGHLLLLE